MYGRMPWMWVNMPLIQLAAIANALRGVSVVKILYDPAAAPPSAL